MAFYTVPGDPALPHENAILEMAATTWSLGWAPGGGACAWDAIVYDEKLNQLYIGTDSGLPWDPEVRSPGGGDNLFLNSIIALDADTGAYKWHYQTVPADAWDLNAANHIILTELELDGNSRKALLQAPKNGFFYVLDRETGELLSAENYVPVKWAQSIDPETGRPVENEGARYYLEEDNSAHTSPTPLGAHNWHAMSYHPTHNLTFIPAQSFGATYIAGANSPLGGVSFHYYDDNLNADQDALTETGKHNTRGRLIAWDVVKKEARWEFFHEYGMNGGVVSTAGDLVFQGAADGGFRAHSVTSGEELWHFRYRLSDSSRPGYLFRGWRSICAGSSGFRQYDPLHDPVLWRPARADPNYWRSNSMVPLRCPNSHLRCQQFLSHRNKLHRLSKLRAAPNSTMPHLVACATVPLAPACVPEGLCPACNT